MVILIGLAILGLISVGIFLLRGTSSYRMKAIVCIGTCSFALFLFGSFITFIAFIGSGDTASENMIWELLRFWGNMTLWAFLWGIVIGSILFGIWNLLDYLKHRRVSKSVANSFE